MNIFVVMFLRNTDPTSGILLGQQPPEKSKQTEDEITPERQQEIEAAVQEIADFNLTEADGNENEAKQRSGKKVEEEDSNEVDEKKIGESTENRKHIYEELLKNKKVIFVTGKLNDDVSQRVCKISAREG